MQLRGQSIKTVYKVFKPSSWSWPPLWSSLCLTRPASHHPAAADVQVSSHRSSLLSQSRYSVPLLSSFFFNQRLLLGKHLILLGTVVSTGPGVIEMQSASVLMSSRLTHRRHPSLLTGDISVKIFLLLRTIISTILVVTGIFWVYLWDVRGCSYSLFSVWKNLPFCTLCCPFL